MHGGQSWTSVGADAGLGSNARVQELKGSELQNFRVQQLQNAFAQNHFLWLLKF
jgi:hypothetical protein